jgi:hypothetical protein
MKYTVIRWYNLVMSWINHDQLPSYLSSYLVSKSNKYVPWVHHPYQHPIGPGSVSWIVAWCTSTDSKSAAFCTMVRISVGCNVASHGGYGEFPAELMTGG